MALGKTFRGIFRSSHFATLLSNNISGGSRLEFVAQSMTWTEADNNCKTLGGYLVTVTSQHVNNRLLEMLREKSQAKLWIGCSDLVEEGKWRWSNPLAHRIRFKGWRYGEPNGKRNENFAGVVRNWGGKWNDFPCHVKAPSVCEIEEFDN